MTHEDKFEKWIIYVPGYGSFDFEGTEAMADKARWEQGIGRKWRVLEGGGIV
jgi:hypothetical protein